MSFYGRDLLKYASYKGHTYKSHTGENKGEAVKQILFTDKGVLSISARSIHFSSRQGLTQWHLA